MTIKNKNPNPVAYKCSSTETTLLTISVLTAKFKRKEFITSTKKKTNLLKHI